MPVILEKQDEKKWLNPQIKNTGLFKNFLKPFPSPKIEIEKSEK